MPRAADQADIDANLSSLPIFLAGSRKLVIAAGPTFTHRLWCIMEVFTFLRIGGNPVERVTLLALGKDADDDTNQVRTNIRFQLLSFRAADADCFHKKDKQRLLDVVKTAFGTLEKFDEAVSVSFAPLLDSETSQLVADRVKRRAGGALSAVSFLKSIQHASKTRGVVHVSLEPVVQSSQPCSA